MNDKIKNIVFDVGMVLIDFCWDKPCREYGFSDEVIAAFEKKMIQSEYWNNMDEGTMTEQEAIVRFKEAMPEYSNEIDKFWEKPEKFVEEYSFAAPLINELHDKGYYVYLLSNYPLHMYEIHWPSFKFFSLVDGYVVSSVEKLCKPNPAIYKLLCDRYHLIPEECLFIDDREVNVDAAKGIGMNGLLFDGEESVRKYIFTKGE